MVVTVAGSLLNRTEAPSLNQGVFMTKSEKVREALKKNPNVNVGKLATKLKVTTGLIYGIRGNLFTRDSPKPVAPRPIVKIDGIKHTIDTIVNVKNLAEELGGMKKLGQLVTAMVD